LGTRGAALRVHYGQQLFLALNREINRNFAAFWRFKKFFRRVYVQIQLLAFKFPGEGSRELFGSNREFFCPNRKIF
jgi:hypothetical protein